MLSRKKVRLTTLGIPLAQPDKFPYGCAAHKALAAKYHKEVNEAVLSRAEIVTDPRQADWALLPSALYLHNPKELRAAKDSVENSGLPCLAFNTPFESARPRWISRLVQFSWYKSRMEPGITICPPFLPEGTILESLGPGPWGPAPKDARPRIGFCGREQGFLGLGLWGALPKFWTRWAAGRPKLSGLRVLRTICRHTLREDAMRLLEAAPAIYTDFVRRGGKMEHPFRAAPELRTVFLANLRANPYALCGRGDENFSWRFFEAMAAGRIPVLIDTNCTLPLEDEIDWDRLIVRVPATRLGKLPEILLARHRQADAAEFARWQEEIRRTYLEKLAPETFFAKFFDNLLKPNKPNPSDQKDPR